MTSNKFSKNSDIWFDIVKRAERMPLLISSRSILKGSKAIVMGISIEFSSDKIDSTEVLFDTYQDQKVIFIVTTIFNDVSFYHKTLESIWNQEEQDLPVVYLIKDASTNSKCIELLKDFIKNLHPTPKHFTCLYWHKPDKSMYEGLKQAFDFISTLRLDDRTITTYINADDILMPYSTKIVSTIFENNDIDWLTGSTRVINEQDSVLFENKFIFTSQDILNHLCDGRSGPFVQQEGTYWSLRLYNKVDGFRDSLKLAGDYNLWQQFARVTNIYFLDQPTGSFRKRKGQKSENLDNYYKEIDSTHIFDDSHAIPKKLKRKHNNARYGYLISSDTPHSFEERIHICNFLAHPIEYIDDPLFCYPKPLGEFKTRYNKKAIFPSINRDVKNIHLGLASLDMAYDPAGYCWYTPVSGDSNWHNISYSFDSKIEKSGILSIRILAINCGKKAELSICLNGIERRFSLSDESSFSSINKALEIDLFFNFRNSLHTSIRFKLKNSDYCFISLHNYSYALPSDLNDYGYLDKRFQGWPYLTNALKPLYSNEYVDKLPLISVVVPTFNQGKTIRDTLSSLFAQHYPKLQVILLDGKSNDSTREVLKDFLGFISEIRSRADSGQSAAIAEGLDLANGDIVTWLNSDDLYAPLALFKVALAYMNGEKPDVIAGNCYVFMNKDFKWIHSCQIWNNKLNASQILDVNNYWLRGKYFHQPEIFFTRSAIKKVEEYCKESFINKDLYYSMDYDIWAKMAISNCSIQKINTVTAMYRLTEEQKTSSVENYLPELLAHSKFLSEKYNIAPTPCIELSHNSINAWSQFKVLFFNDVGFFGGAGIAHERIATSLALYGLDVKCIAVSDTWIEEKHFIDLTALKAKLGEEEPNLIICGNIHGIKNNHLEILKLLSSQCPCWFVVHDYWITNGSIPYPSLDWKRPLGDTLQSSHEWIASINDIPNLFLVPNSDYCKKIVSLCKFEGIIQSDFHLSLKKTQTDANCGSLQVMTQKQTIGKLVIALGSVGLLEDRKRVSILIDALKIMPKKVLSNLKFESYGSNSLDEISQYCDYKHHGYLNQIEVQEILNTADIYINTSLIETFGQTTLESIDNGLICLSNYNGGSSEMITNGYNAQNLEMTGEALALALSDLHDSLMSDEIPLDCKNKIARSLSVSRFSSQSQGYSLIKAIANSGQFIYPVGGQKVQTIDPDQLILPLELL